MAKTRKVQLADGRTVRLTDTQVRAVRAIHKAGTYYAYNGISRATVGRLEDLGILAVTWNTTSTTSYRTKRTRWILDWSATIAPGALKTA